jgi:phytoene dehydrogenase-like protein
MALLDAVVIGGGHNGLTCAAYLGMAGLSVRVLERREIVGGAAITQEVHPGFRNSVAAYTVSLLQPKVIRDLGLHRYGLKIVERRAQNFLPTEDGRYLLTGEGRTQREIAKFSAADAARYPDYAAETQRIAAVLRDLVLEAPPNMAEGGVWRTLAELGKLAMLGNRLRRLNAQTRRALLDLFTKSAGDYLDS